MIKQISALNYQKRKSGLLARKTVWMKKYQMKKKKIKLSDGRSLIFYSFPEKPGRRKKKKKCQS